MSIATTTYQLLDLFEKHIMCAICERPVKRVAREQSFEDDAFRFKVWCHGDEDNCVIPRQVIENMTSKNLEPGYAFSTSRITAPGLEGQDTGASSRSVDSVAQTDRR